MKKQKNLWFILITTNITIMANLYVFNNQNIIIKNIVDKKIKQKHTIASINIIFRKIINYVNN